MSSVALELLDSVDVLAHHDTKTLRLLGRFLLTPKGTKDSWRVGYRLGTHLQDVLGQETDCPFVEFEEGASDMTEVVTSLLRRPDSTYSDKLESDMEADILGYAVSVAHVLEGGLPLDGQQRSTVVKQLYRRARTTI